MIRHDGSESRSAERGRAPETVAHAERFLSLVETIAAANRPLLPTMSEKAFRRVVIRMAEHQLLYENHRDERS
jgi:hypothetical protein